MAPSTRPTAFAIGEVVGGRYEILEIEGEGGFAHVFRARDQDTDREVAVKQLRPKRREDPASLERFRREAEVLKALAAEGAPHVPRLHDTGEHGGLLYHVLDLVPGRPLHAWIREQREGCDEAGERYYSDPVTACAIALQISAALAQPHTRGMFHRDVNPNNIMLDVQDGMPRVTLIDFGLVRVEGASTAVDLRRQAGTLDYLSPEQMRAQEEVGAETDVFAVGVVLHELLTGTAGAPEGERWWAAAPKIGGAEVSRAIRAARPDAPEALTRVIARALAGAPSDRYSDASAFQTALEAAAKDLTAEVLVAQAGGGNFRTLAAALRIASPAAHIRLRAGEYTGPVVIEGRSQTVLAGEPGALLRGGDAPALVVAAGRARIEQLEIAGDVELRAGGSATLIGCEVRGSVGSSAETLKLDEGTVEGAVEVSGGRLDAVESAIRGGLTANDAVAYLGGVSLRGAPAVRAERSDIVLDDCSVDGPIMMEDGNLQADGVKTSAAHPAPSPRPRRLNATQVGAGACLLLAGALAGYLGSRAAPPPSEREPVIVRSYLLAPDPSTPWAWIDLAVPGGAPVRAVVTESGAILLGSLKAGELAVAGVGALSLDPGMVIVACDGVPVSQREALTRCADGAERPPPGAGPPSITLRVRGPSTNGAAEDRTLRVVKDD